MITGTLSRPRGEVARDIEAAGGRAVSNVSKNTDFVAVGESPGSKLDRTRELGTRTIDEKELERMLRKGCMTTERAQMARLHVITRGVVQGAGFRFFWSATPVLWD